MKYRVRCFYSKGAFLVLLWMTFVSITCWSFCRLYPFLFLEDLLNLPYSHFGLISLLPFLIFAPLSGWVADSRCSNFTVFKVGVILLFLGSALGCAVVLFDGNVRTFYPVYAACGSLVFVILLVGATACMVTALQLGLDQMPDASPSNTISFINWFVFSVSFGMWTSDSLWILQEHCFASPLVVNAQVFSLLPVLSITIVCCTIFLLAPKWLTIEPRSPQALKTIYQVLKFAAKHKAPLNRSALTYWEEDIPSRLDLGKSRFGGPFTTEQVEDVKTFFKILIIHLPFFISSMSFQTLFFDLKVVKQGNLDECSISLINIFSYNYSLCSMLVTMVTELVIYPLVKFQPPSLIKRMGIVCFVIFFSRVGFLIAYVVGLADPFAWLDIVYSVYFGCVYLNIQLSTVLQFVCAQSPYSMRGLLSGYSILLQLLSLGMGDLVLQLVHFLCDTSTALNVNMSVAVVLSLLGFTLHCVLAHWYKRRVRDEEYNVHRVVEEVYDRYLSQSD